MNRLCNAVAWLVVTPIWFPLWLRDRRMRKWVDITHEPMENER